MNNSNPEKSESVRKVENEGPVKIDVEAIMKEIQADIEKRKLDGTILPFDDIPVMSAEVSVNDGERFNYQELLQNLNAANQKWQIPVSYPLGGGRFSSFLRRVIRKCVRFTYAPIVSNQNEFNATIVRYMNQVRHYLDEQTERNKQLEEKLRRQEGIIRDLKKQIGEK